MSIAMEETDFSALVKMPPARLHVEPEEDPPQWYRLHLWEVTIKLCKYIVL